MNDLLIQIVDGTLDCDGLGAPHGTDLNAFRSSSLQIRGILSTIHVKFDYTFLDKRVFLRVDERDLKRARAVAELVSM